MRILITGGSGLVGQATIAALGPSHEIFAPSRTELDLSGHWESTHLPTQIDAVIHTAQSRSWRDFPASSQETFDINVGATQSLLEYARKAGAQRFILTSTGGVYAPADHLLHESSPLRTPNELDFYAATKLGAEQLALAYCSQFNVTVLRLFTVYGQGEDPHSLVPRLRSSISGRRTITIQGTNGVILRPTHADDVASAIHHSLSANGLEICNIAGPDVMSLAEMCDRIALQCGVEPLFEVQAGPQQWLAPDIELMVNALGAPTVAFTG